MTDFSTKPTAREPSLWLALIPVASLIGILSIVIFKFEGAPHIPLILASAIAAAVGVYLGNSWKDIEQGIVDGIVVSLKAMLILMVIGIMIGTWIASGIVPMLINLGLSLLSPSVFLVAACAICAIVSFSTGSSWTTAGTVGVALIGVGTALQVPIGMSAGAIISGSYFGDKMSPLSDTTNLAPAVAGSELFEHIRYMAYTTVPALIISLVLYAILGFFVGSGQISGGNVEEIRATISASFKLNPLLIAPPALVIVMVVYRIPALPALLGGAALGAVCAVLFQGASIGEIFAVAHSGYVSETGVAAVDDLLTRGGLESMMSTVALIICALSFGGIMERTGMLKAIAGSILKLAKSTGSLVATTVATCFGMNILAPDQYLSIVVPGRMYKEAYAARGLHPKNLSRTLEDAGTLSSPLVPWNTCGAFMCGALLPAAGVSPFVYLPYAFLNILTPIIAIVLAYTGWKIAMLPKAESGEVAKPTD